jgi:hypothetical protein
MLSVILLSVVLLRVLTMNVVKLSVIIPIAILLNVMAPVEMITCHRVTVNLCAAPISIVIKHLRRHDNH